MSGWIDTMNRLADAWAPAMLRACWQGGAAVALVWAWCRLLRRTPAAAQCWLWRLAHLKLLAAFLWVTPVALPLLKAPATVREAAVASPALVGEAAAVGVKLTAELVVPAAPSHVPMSVMPPPIRTHGIPWLFVAWLVGVSACVFRLAWRWVQTVRLRRRCVPVLDVAMNEVLKELAGLYRLPRPPRLASAECVASPLLLAGGRPLVVLPDSLLAVVPAELRLVLAHELAHLKRRDLQWNALAAAVGCLFYFHPLLWLARRGWRLSQEVACDDAALAATAARPGDYARALLRVVEGLRVTPRRFAMPLVAVGISQPGRTLERRLLAMKQFNKPSRRGLWLAGVVVAAAGAVGVPSWKVVAQEVRDTQPAREGPATRPSARDATADRPAGAGIEEPIAGPRMRVVGTVYARKAEIRSPESGPIKEVLVKEGQRVKAGELLARTDDRLAQLQVRAAEADLMKKQIERERYDRFQKQQPNPVGLTSIEVQLAAAEVESAKIALTYRRVAVEQHRVVAPFDGVISSWKAFAGGAPSDGMLGTLVEVDDLWVQFPAANNVMLRLQTGMAIRVFFGGSRISEEACEGRIEFISPESDPQTGTTTAKAKVKGSAGWLRPGAVVSVELPLPARDPPSQRGRGGND